MRNNMEDRHISKQVARPSKSPVESPSCHNGFSLDLDDHKNKWSRHRSFLYGCDRSPKVHVLELGIEIPNLKQNNLSMKLV